MPLIACAGACVAAGPTQAVTALAAANAEACFRLTSLIILYLFIFSSNLNGKGRRDPAYNDILAPAIYDCQGCQLSTRGSRVASNAITRRLRCEKASFEEAITHMKGIASVHPAKTTLDWADNDDVALRLAFLVAEVTKLQHESPWLSRPL